MKIDDVVNSIAGMDPEQLRDTFSRLARVFTQKAESLYDANPTSNGEIAQPYADIADFMEEASMVFEQQEAVIDAETSLVSEPPPATLTDTIIRSRPKKGWGDY